jgi:hypothetical protein
MDAVEGGQSFTVTRDGHEIPGRPRDSRADPAASTSALRCPGRARHDVAERRNCRCHRLPLGEQSVARFDRVDQRIDRLENRIDRLENKVRSGFATSADGHEQIVGLLNHVIVRLDDDERTRVSARRTALRIHRRGPRAWRARGSGSTDRSGV